jgi:hypothetical protein
MTSSNSNSRLFHVPISIAANASSRRVGGGCNEAPQPGSRKYGSVSVVMIDVYQQAASNKVLRNEA